MTYEKALKPSFKDYRRYFRKYTFSNIRRLRLDYGGLSSDRLYKKYKESYDYLLSCAKKLKISKFHFDRGFDYITLLNFTFRSVAFQECFTEFAKLLENKSQRQKARKYYQKCHLTPEYHFVDFSAVVSLNKTKKMLEDHFESLILNRKPVERRK